MLKLKNKINIFNLNLSFFYCTQPTHLKSPRPSLKSKILPKHPFYNDLYWILLVPCLSSYPIWRNRNSQLCSVKNFTQIYWSLQWRRHPFFLLLLYRQSQQHYTIWILTCNSKLHKHHQQVNILYNRTHTS